MNTNSSFTFTYSYTSTYTNSITYTNTHTNYPLRESKLWQGIAEKIGQKRNKEIYDLQWASII
jgi:hypothetical protein